jgi:hypothetical protein
MQLFFIAKNSYFSYICKFYFQLVFILYLFLSGVDNVSLTVEVCNLKI